MKKQTFLAFMPEFNAYGISDNTIKTIQSQGNTPIISMIDKDYTSLGGTNNPNKPLIGFLLGRENSHYTIDYNYAKAIVLSGVKIRFLTYENPLEQMDDLTGLILPGGAFSSPDQFYCDGKTLYQPNQRYEAYKACIQKAEAMRIPILGVCAGAQMVAGLHFMNLYRDASRHTDLEHKTKERNAHKVQIYPDTILRELLGADEVMTNSRHREAINPAVSSDLQIYASTRDGIPEAWGNEEKGILCVQWHSEDFAAEGDHRMQNIYNWLANKAANYHQKK